MTVELGITGSGLREIHLSGLCVIPFFLFFMIFYTGSTHAAPSILSVGVQPSTVTVNKNAVITVTGIGQCRFRLRFGDGISILIDHNFSQGNYETAHSWNTTGAKTVRVIGKQGCQGQKQANVKVTKIKMTKLPFLFTCPQGWRKAGKYTCIPDPPESLKCPDGYMYSKDICGPTFSSFVCAISCTEKLPWMK